MDNRDSSKRGSQPQTEMDTLVETEPGGGPRHDAPPSNPKNIGPYRIVERLGSGGMGTVFLAEQTEPVQRLVAVKIMRSTFLDPEGKARFEAERQAMARLQHPNVAQIFAADATEEGHPYFVMEHVEGQEIVSYCDNKRLSIKDRLLLFCDVCSGAQHAHQKGIIHRDLKPSNILVTEIEGRPVPKIIDFGIAKALDRPLGVDAVVTGDRLIGTPAYLSPEAANLVGNRLDLDTRSDVFSLGILLYELLVGHRPFDDEHTNLFQVLQRIAVEEPSGPSSRWSDLAVSTRDVIAQQRHLDAATLHKSLQGDLDWIVLKAIARDREQRYGSTAELAADIQRHLRHEPVEASPPSNLYRLQKFVRRRLGAVISSLIVVLALAIGFAARTLEADRANREAAAAIEARRQTEVALAEAEQARSEAAEVSKFLIDLFSVSDPGEARGSSVTARELLDNASQEIRQGLTDQPLARALFMQTMAEVYRKLGLYDKAGPLFDEALELRRARLPPDHLDIALSLNGKAALLAALGDPQAALPLFVEALDIRQKNFGTDDPRLAPSLSNLGNLYADLERFEEAEPLLLRAVNIAEFYEGPHLQTLLVAFNNLGSYYLDQGRFEEAQPLLLTFVEKQRAAVGADHPWVAFGLENLGEIRYRLEDPEGALAYYGEALSILEKVYGTEHPEFGYCLGKLGTIYASQGDRVRAKEHFRRALSIHRAVLPEGHPYLTEVVEGLAALNPTAP